MMKKKDLYNLHCRIEHITADKLKAWSDEMGLSVGEMIDQVVDGYEHYCNTEDQWLERANYADVLKTLLDKVEKIEKKVGAE